MLGYKEVKEIIKKHKDIVLSLKEQDEMIVKFQDTGYVDIRNLVIASITKEIARSSFNYSRKTSIDSYALFTEGYYGALWAADRYDVSKNVHFFSYVKLYIKKYQLELVQKEIMAGFGMDHRKVKELQDNIKEGKEERHSFHSEIKTQDGGVECIFETIPDEGESVEDILNEIEKKEIANRMISELGDTTMITSILSEEITMADYSKQNNIPSSTLVKRMKKIKNTLKNNVELLEVE